MPDANLFLLYNILYMNIQKKPYLVIPYLIEQPTWGGEYICEKKRWLDKPDLKGKKIGQSYELYGKSLLALDIVSSEDTLFSPRGKNTIPVSSFSEVAPFPLIKFTQAKGNSFQLHVPTGVKDEQWHSKAESWYFFEGGKVTFGINTSKDIGMYKKICVLIEQKMKELSEKLIGKKITRDEAEKEANQFIKEQNPWNYVNVHEVKAGDSVDLSGGGIHHSWEEDEENHPLGNIVYEVQQDVMDPISTLRSFDQGKFLNDGTIREIQIETYFKYLDTNKERNILKIRQNEAFLFNTPYYILKKWEIQNNKEMSAEKSFHHLFVKEGTMTVRSVEGEVFVSRGHSCFIPKGVSYTIEVSGKTEILQTSSQ